MKAPTTLEQLDGYQTPREYIARLPFKQPVASLAGFLLIFLIVVAISSAFAYVTFNVVEFNQSISRSLQGK